MNSCCRQVLGSKPTIDRPPATRTSQSSREILLAQRRAKQQNIAVSNAQFTPLPSANTHSLDNAQQAAGKYNLTPFLSTQTRTDSDTVSDCTQQPLLQPPQSTSSPQSAGPSDSRSSGSTPTAPPGSTSTVNPSNSAPRGSAATSSNVTNPTNPTTPQPEGNDHNRDSEISHLHRRTREDSPMTGSESEREEEAEVPKTGNKGKGRTTDSSDTQPEPPPVATTRKRRKSGRRWR